MFHYLLYITFCIILLAHTTNVTSTNQYITPDGSSTNLMSNVTCNSGVNCYISCITNACHFLTIYAENANNLYLKCIGTSSCAQTNIITPNQGNLSINCNKNTTNGNGACQYMQLYINIINNLNINCEMEQDCYGIIIDDLSINTIAINTVNISFNGYKSGYDAHIEIYNIYNSFQINCNGNRSCISSTIYCPIINANKIECNILCAGELSCLDMNYHIKPTTYITDITCPTDTNCYIYCNGISQCRTMHFYGEHAKNMYLICIDKASCGQTDVYGPNYGDLSIDCNSNVNGNHYSDDTTYGEGSCEYMQIYGDNIEQFKLNCQFDFDCLYITYDIKPAKYVTIHYKGRRSGYGSWIQATNLTGYFDLVCNGTETCKGVDLYCPVEGPTCNVKCIGTSSCAKMNYYIPSNDYDKLIISCSEFEKTHCFTINNTLFPLSYDAEIYCQDTQEYSELIYNPYNQILSCHENCCPFLVEEIEECSGSDSIHCVIDCSKTFCDGRIIDATHKASIAVYCKENDINSMCNGLHIICPLNGLCLIECNVTSGCKTLNITQNTPIINVNDYKCNIILKCMASSSCRNINITATNTFYVTVNASSYNSLVASEIHVENTNYFELNCYKDNEIYHEFKSCENNRIFLSDNIDNSVDIYCTGKSCGNVHFYVYNKWNENMNVNIISNCQCNEYWRDCMADLVGIFCDYNNKYYNKFEEINHGQCSDLCGCNNLITNIENNFIDDSNIECEDINYHLLNNTNMIDATNVLETKNENTKGNGGIWGIIMSIIMIIGFILFLWYFCVYKKQKQQVRGVVVKQTSHLPGDHNDDYIDDEIELNSDDNKLYTTIPTTR